MRTVKQSVARAMTPLCAFAMRHGSLPVRRTLWLNVCSPYLAWRDHPFVRQTEYGFAFSGNAADLVPKYVYYFGTWEPTITAFVRALDLRQRTFVDVGANLGWYSLLASKAVGPRGRVVAIEASPVMLDGLKRNIALNGFANVRVVNNAAWCEHAVLQLYSGPSDNLGQTTLKPGFARTTAVAEPTRYDVIAAPLGALLTPEEIGSAAVLKIDVEGAEKEVLEGVLDALPRFPRDVKLLLELTPDDTRNSPWIVETLREAGFRMFRLDNAYTADFYLSPPPLRLTEISGDIAQQIDVVFSRDALC